ncbi:MAG: glycosyltransferase [Xanthobacteraceae bacterium]
MAEPMRPTVSIIIKAFNEERRIAAAIESALAALADIDGEVILADGASTDRTIAIAQTYPIKIVRLDRAADRSCGAGAQLGFQYSNGEFLWLMDGDMQLDRHFLAAGVRYLQDNPTAAGVSGIVINRDVVNLEYVQRLRRFDPDLRPGPVTRLAGCGLYRRSAIDSIGYSTDRNLHGGEELELSARLQSAGWTLTKIDRLAVEHYCHTGNTYWLLLRRMKTRNACSPGEILRASLGRSHFGFVVRHNRNALFCGSVALWWALIAAAALFASGVAAIVTSALLLVFPFAVMSWRWRSLRSALYSVAVWNVQALCFLPGFFWPRKPPASWIPSSVIKDQLPPRATCSRRSVEQAEARIPFARSGRDAVHPAH